MADMLQALGHTALRIDCLRCIRKLAVDHGKHRSKFEGKLTTLVYRAANVLNSLHL